MAVDGFATLVDDPGWKDRAIMRTMGRPLLVVGALAVALIAGLVGVSQLKFTSFVSDSINGRLEVVATAAAQDFGAAIDLGLSLDQVANGPEILTRARRHDRTITAIYVVDLVGTIIHASGDAPGTPDEATIEAFGLAVDGIGESTWDTETDDTIHSGTLIEGSFGQPVGGVVVEYPIAGLRSQSREMARSLIAIGSVVAIAVIVAAAIVLVIASWRRHTASDEEPGGVDGEEATEPRVIATVMSVILIIGVVSFGLLAVPAFNSALAPELERRAALIGETVGDDTARALNIGIPITKLVGVDEYFSEYLDTFPEINHLAIRALDDTVLYASDRITDSGGAPWSSRIRHPRVLDQWRVQERGRRRCRCRLRVRQLAPEGPGPRHDRDPHRLPCDHVRDLPRRRSPALPTLRRGA